MKRAVIFLNGDSVGKDRILKFVKKTDTIICADGGTRYALSSGLTPDIVLGDFDSISPSLQKKLVERKIKLLVFKKDKDQTDSELAIDYALKNGFKEILVFGISGTRLDHSLGTLMFLVHHADNILVTVIEKTQVISVLRDSELIIRGKKGDYVSLIPMTVKTNGISTQGLKFPLHNASLPFGKTLSISNELLKKKAKVTVSSGVLLIVHTDTNFNI